MGAFKTIDKRNASEALEYAISFASRALASSDDYEHAFVVWFYSDEQHQRTNRKAAGFYPTGDPSAFDLLIGGTTGKVFDDSKQRIEKELVVLVNSDVFNAAKNVEGQYSADQTYRLLTNDCLTYVETVAGVVPGLNLPSRILHPTPSLYVAALFDSN